MQRTNSTRCIQIFPGRPSGRASGIAVAASRRLAVVLSCGLLIAAGPAVLGAVTQASLVAIQIVIEVGRVGLIAYQLVGR
jgi:hypothetical protein